MKDFDRYLMYTLGLILVFFCVFNIDYKVNYNTVNNNKTDNKLLGDIETISINSCKDINKPTLYIRLNIDDKTVMEDNNTSDKELLIPNKDGYRFDGWYYDADFKEKTDYNKFISFNPTILNEKDSNSCRITVFKKYLDLYAKFTKINQFNDDKCTDLDRQYYVKFYNTDIRTKYITEPTILEVPSKSGYIFEGWYYDAEFKKSVETNELYELDVVTYKRNGCIENYKDVDLYAKFVKVEDRLKENSDSNKINKIFVSIIVGLIIITGTLIIILRKK